MNLAKQQKHETTQTEVEFREDQYDSGFQYIDQYFKSVHQESLCSKFVKHVTLFTMHSCLSLSALPPHSNQALAAFVSTPA
jgi:hypothetical protein